VWTQGRVRVLGPFDWKVPLEFGAWGFDISHSHSHRGGWGEIGGKYTDRGVLKLYRGSSLFIS